jgi:hypothetical protein
MAVRQVHQVGTGRVHRIDLAISVPVRLEGDRGAIGPPSRVEVLLDVMGEVRRIAAVGVHHPDVVRDRVTTVKGDLLPVGRPRRASVYCRPVGEAGLSRSVGVHDIDLGVAVPVADERDLGTVRRPGGLGVVSRARELYLTAAVRGHDPDLRTRSLVPLERDKPIRARERGVRRFRG